MIKIRNGRGKVLNHSDEVRFIELRTTDDKIGAVIYLDDTGAYTIFDARDQQQARHYTKMFNVEFAEPVELSL